MTSTDEQSVNCVVDVAERDEDYLFTAFKKLKVDPQWSEDWLVSDVSSTAALRDLWAGKTAKSRPRSKHRLRSHKKHRRSSKLPYSVDSLPSMDKLTLSKEKCLCTSCTHCQNNTTFGLTSKAFGNESILKEARLKLHHQAKDRKNVIWKAKLNLGLTATRAPPPGASSSSSALMMPQSIFGVMSKSPSFNDVATGDSSSSSSTATTTNSATTTCSSFTPASVFSRNDQIASSSSDNSTSEKRSRDKSGRSRRPRTTCSQEAKLEEMTVDELAGYLENYVHIPKKMSQMAEMMYT